MVTTQTGADRHVRAQNDDPAPTRWSPDPAAIDKTARLILKETYTVDGGYIGINPSRIAARSVLIAVHDDPALVA
jgi:hypothetical protein